RRRAGHLLRRLGRRRPRVATACGRDRRTGGGGGRVAPRGAVGARGPHLVRRGSHAGGVFRAVVGGRGHPRRGGGVPGLPDRGGRHPPARLEARLVRWTVRGDVRGVVGLA